MTRVLLAVALLAPALLHAQDSSRFVVGAGVGGTYYCIITRCDTGTTLVATAGYAPTPPLVVEAAIRWHDCFDCKRFFIGEGTVKLRHQGRIFAPFFGLGAGVGSDPDFFGTVASAHAAIGSWIWPADRWGLQIEVRGRRIERGDGMAEASVMVMHRLPGRNPEGAR